ncbi:MAG: LPS export ABC transporter periplasmic protein LptC [Bdellovibrionaceae bacterium]|nr:LPS export ABC transporter periplasmic protein LptC [Pseudobdellovibrionaceae bacterium]
MWSIFYLLEERKNSWNIVIKQITHDKVITSIEGFSAFRKYKTYLVSVLAKTAIENDSNENRRWVLKDITLTVKWIAKSKALKPKVLILKSQSAIFDKSIGLLRFTDTAYISFSKYNVEVQDLQYDFKTSQLFSNTKVAIKSNTFYITSKGLKLNLTPLQIKLFSKVKLQFTNQLSGSSITSEKLSYNFKDHFVFNKQVKIIHKAYKSFSNQLIFNNSKEQLQYALKGNVSIFIGGHNFKGQMILFNPIDQSIEIKKGKIQVDESLNF